MIGIGSRAFLLSFLIVFAASSQTPSSSTYSVVYTGRLFGYFRYPEVQSKADTGGCPDPKAFQFGAAVQSFDTVSQSLPKIGTTVRVAVGDNFAPFLLAREMRVPAGHFVGKDEYSYFPGEPGNPAPPAWVPTGIFERDYPNAAREERNGNGVIPNDNAGCFLRLMQFDAIVPGKHDFYFGPERLRQLARFLWKPEPQYKRVAMLGANLTIATNRVIPDPSLPADRLPHQDFLLEAPRGFNVSAVLPSTPLPFLREIRIQNVLKICEIRTSSGALYSGYTEDLLGQAMPTPSGFAALVNLLGPGRGMGAIAPIEVQIHGDTFTLLMERRVRTIDICPAQSGHPNVLTGAPCINLLPMLSPDDRLDTTVGYRIPNPANLAESTPVPYALPPGRNYAVCFSFPAGGHRLPFCQPFTVHTPFFTHPHETIAAGDPPPFVIVPSAGGASPSVAIFGIVDPDLRQYIGTLNDSWLKSRDGSPRTDPDYTTAVEVGAGTEALKQVMQYCNTQADCRGARKILLAHMPRGKAAQLVASLGAPTFDVVIAQTDPSRASGDQSAESTIHIGPHGVNSVVDPIVLVPGSHTDDGLDPNQIRPRIQRALVTITSSPTFETRKMVNNAVRAQKAVPVSPLDLPPSSLPALRTAVPGTGLFERLAKPPYSAGAFAPVSGVPLSIAARRSGLESIALKAMRDACHADASFLQHRDVYLAPGFGKGGLTDDGYAAAIHAIYWKGDFISCMRITGDTISKLLAQSDVLKASENNEVVTDLERGRDLAKLGIERDAITDAWNINGEILNPAKLYSVATTDFLSAGDTGYSMLQNAEPAPPSLIKDSTRLHRLSAAILFRLGSASDPKPKAGQYLDTSTLAPANISRGMTPGRSFRDWWTRAFQTRTAITQPVTGVWYLNLDKADAGYTLFLHNMSEAGVGTTFAGITSPNLSSTESKDILFDYIVRLRHLGKRWDYFAESDMNFEYNAQRVKLAPNDEPYQASQKADYWFQQTGAALRLKPASRNPWGFKLMLPAAMQTQVAPPFTIFTLSDNQIYTAKTTRSYYVSARPGLRYEGPKSWIEAGYQVGNIFRQPKEYDFTNPQNANVVPCPVRADLSVSECVTNNKVTLQYTFSVLTRSHFQNGLYLNFRLDMPLPFSGAEYIMENRGDFFFNSAKDSTIDIRGLDTWSHTFAVPIYGKLSLAPSLTLFFYKNKDSGTPPTGGHLYYSYSTKVTLSYNFEWHSGLGWKKALKFSNPVPTLAPLPTH